MPQARLPDVNTSFIKWRNKAVTSLESENYTACIGALTAFNADLPTKYQVKISNAKYHEKLEAEKVNIECHKCHAESDFRTVQKYDLLMSPIHELVTGSQQERVWLCECGEENLISSSKMINLKLPDPTFFGIVPEPPQRKDGVMDRKTYHKKIEKWVWTMISELEAKAAQFRDDNWQKSSVVLDDDSIDGKEDEQ